MTHKRPKECMEEMENRFDFVDITYNEHLGNSWSVVCRTEGGSKITKGNDFVEVLNEAVENY